jgi:hypothetical protein
VRVALVGGGETVCPTGAVPEVVAIVAYDDGQRLETRTPTPRALTVVTTTSADR